jgi:hypothetical protein
MGDGTGSGPSGSIGDPNGAGPGAAAPNPGAEVVEQPAPAPAGPGLSRSDAATLKFCRDMPRARMVSIAKCKALIAKHPELFSAPSSMP